MYKAVEEIIPRTPDPIVEDLMNKLSNTIDRFVDFGSNILKWDTEVRRPEEYNNPILMSYRHFLDLTDSTSILVKQSGIEPCKLILRGMLETYFSLAFMLEENTEDRCMAFLTWQVHKRIKATERDDPNTEIGKQFRKKLSKDKFISSIQIPGDPNSKRKRVAFEMILQKAEYQKAEQEYQRLKLQDKKSPAWHRFFEGPRNIEELADHLKMTSIYETLYRDWSGPTHGTDVLEGKVSVAQDGTAEIFQIRHFGSAQKVVQWVLALSLMMFDLYIDNRIPDKRKDFIAWFPTIREAYYRICDSEPLLNVI